MSNKAKTFWGAWLFFAAFFIIGSLVGRAMQGESTVVPANGAALLGAMTGYLIGVGIPSVIPAWLVSLTVKSDGSQAKSGR